MKKLLYLVSEDWFFCSHFIERAAAALAAGYDVTVMTHLTAPNSEAAIRARGLKLVPFGLDRGSTNPFKEIAVIGQVYRAYRAIKPDIVHHVAMKPVLYGTIAALLAGVPAIVNAPVGMGYIFSSYALRAQILRVPLKVGLWILLNPRRSKVIFENEDDLNRLTLKSYVAAKDAVLIRGAGIDLGKYAVKPEPQGVPVVILVARMLRDKGVVEFVEAARMLRARGVKARFLLVGAPDALNHAAISEDMLRGWHREGVVEWLGQRREIPELLQASAIACLPSYREGLPKSLLEALSCGRPVVTTDVEGCRETVTDGLNGFVVPAKNAQALADALQKLIDNPALRQQMGHEGRRRAETEFSQQRIIDETLQVYAGLQGLW
ncbi:MAG: glycosyltransferase family 4 protein [Alphaproteobacteria bacterium]|nr:glycosyltransferase family 4 protein [Alphaproteobacteria bacterium]